MAIPQIVSGSEVQTPGSGTQINSASFRDAALSPGRMAAQIGQDVGGVFQDISQKLQANRNARQVFDADLTMRKTKDDFTANLVKMPDEGTWLPAWKEQVDQTRQNVIDNPHAGPEVKRILSQKFDVWEAATSAEVRTAALLKGVKETRESAIADSTYAAHQGDVEGAGHILQAAVDHYAMSPEEAHKISTRFPSIAAQAQADMVIASNPIKAPETIKKFQGTIEPNVFVGLQAKARAAQSAAQSSNLDALAQQMDADPSGTIDPEVLTKNVESGEITQAGMNGLMGRMRREALARKSDSDKTSREEMAAAKNKAQNDHSLLMMEANDFDWVGAPDMAQASNDLKEQGAGLPAPLRRSLYAHIDSQVASAKKEGTSIERPVIKEQLDNMKADFESGSAFVPMFGGKPATTPFFTLFGHSVGGSAAETPKYLQGGVATLKKMTDEEFKADYGDVTRGSVIEAARLNYADKQAKFLAWARDPANKDATPQEAIAERMRLEQPDVAASVVRSLTPGAKPSFAKGERRRQNGSVYEFDGSKWTVVK